VTTKVTIADKGKGNKILLNGKVSKATVTKWVVRLLAPDQDVQVRSKLDLPIGQGLGMSGAGAMSTALAIADALDISKKMAVQAAHRAEIKYRTGLGDVGPQSVGGMTIRLKPGIPPYGKIRSIPVDEELEIVVGIVGPSISTKKIITDSTWKRRINKAGRDCVDGLSKRPTLDALFSLSRRFAEGTGLVSRTAARALRAVDRVGMASMSMIGNSLYAHGEDTGRLARAMKRHVKKVYICHVDNKGARVL